MSHDERKNRTIITPHMEPTEKYKLLIQETNKENFELGKPTHPLYPVEK
jgi:virulence-associated protein VagC